MSQIRNLFFFLLIFTNQKSVFSEIPPMDLDDRAIENRERMDVDESVIEYEKKPANIVILLDRYSQRRVEERPDATQLWFQESVDQCVPILVSGQILKNYIKRINFAGGETYEKFKDFELYILKQSDLYLILPKNIHYKDGFNLGNEEFLEKIEISVLQESSANDQWPKNRSDYEQDNWINGIKKVFKIGTDYWWNIFLLGHGINKKTETEEMAYLYEKHKKNKKQEAIIAGLDKKDFINIINFLSNKDSLNVFFFYYSTCYGGGCHLETPYIQRNNIIKDIFEKKILPFTVISGTPRYVKGHQISINYEKIFEILNDILNSKVYKSEHQFDLWKLLLKEFTKNIESEPGLLSANYPLIKFASTEKFLALSASERVKIISNILLKKKKLENDNFIRISNKIKTIFVYPNYIDVPIIIDGESPPLITSINPGPNIHYFNEIIINGVDSIEKVFDLFFDRQGDPSILSEPNKLFAVKKIIYDMGKMLTNFIVSNELIIFLDNDQNENAYSRNMKYPGSRIHVWGEAFALSQRLLNDYKATKMFEWYKNAINGYEFLPQDFEAWRKRERKILFKICDDFKIGKKYKALFLLAELSLYPTKGQEFKGHYSMIDKIFFYYRQEVANSVFIENRSLNLSDSNITDDVLEKITKIILKLNKLYPIRMLSLARNKITKIPKELFKLRDLEVLDLSSCRLRSVPNEFGMLYRLKRLSLSDNNDLSSVPKTVANLKRLEYLNLSGLQTIKLPQAFDRLNLEIDGNYIFEERIQGSDFILKGKKRVEHEAYFPHENIVSTKKKRIGEPENYIPSFP